MAQDPCLMFQQQQQQQHECVDEKNALPMSWDLVGQMDSEWLSIAAAAAALWATHWGTPHQVDLQASSQMRGVQAVQAQVQAQAQA